MLGGTLGRTIWRIYNKLRQRRNTKRHGHAYLLSSASVDWLDRHLWDRNRNRKEPQRDYVGFSDLAEYHAVFAPERTASCSDNQQLWNARSSVRRQFQAFKQLDELREVGGGVFKQPTLKPKQAVFVTGHGDVVAGTWRESLHNDAYFRESELSGQELGAATTVSGLCASLLGPWTGNFYHWLIQYIPRLKLIDEICGLENVGHFLISDPVHSYHKETLTYFGVDADRLLPVAGPVRPDQCVITSIPCENRYIPSWVAEFMARKSASSPWRKTFVVRGKSARRQLVNDREVRQLAERHGYSCVDPGQLPFADQARLFAESAAVCGVHGAALSNLAFCCPDTAVLEFVPANYAYPCFERLALGMSLSYEPLFGIEPSSRLLPQMLADADIRIDLRQLDQHLGTAPE